MLCNNRMTSGSKQAKIELIRSPRWSQCSLNKMAATAKVRKIFKRHLIFGQWPDFKIFAQKCSSNGPVPKLLNGSTWLNKTATRAKNESEIQDGCNGSAPLNKMAARAKFRKIFKRHLLYSQWPYFKVISQKCSSYCPLPK